MEDPLRRQLVREAMAEERLDALLCLLPENVLLLTGYWPLSSFAVTLYPREAEPLLLVVDLEREAVGNCLVKDVRVFAWGSLAAGDPWESIEGELHSAAKGMGLGPYARVGFETGFETVASGYGAGEARHISASRVKQLASALGEVEIVDATPALMRARRIKTPREIAALRKAHALAEIGLHWFHDHLVVGLRESELAAGVEASIRSNAGSVEGVQHGRGLARVMSGPRTVQAWSPFPVTSDRRLEKGDLVLLELAVVADGFWAALTRTHAAGRSDARQREGYEAIQAAHRAALAAARPGVTGTQVDAAAREALAKAGWGEGFLHILGHGLGFSYHEPFPMLAPGWDLPLEAGMVSSLEPGVYLEGFGGMRREEDILITEGGAEYLSTFDHDLD